MADERQLTPREIDANIDKLQAQASQANAEAARALAEQKKLENEATLASIVVAREQRKETAELARNHYYHLYVFDTAVSSKSVEECMQKLAEWSRTEPDCDIEIIFNSPGGSIVDGMALFDFLGRMKNSGHKITTSTMGMAASMAGVLLQAGSVRKMGPESWLLVHQAQFGAMGSFGEVEDQVEWVKKMQERILDIFASRSKISKATIKRKWTRTNWWLDADEALECGFIDEIG